jgi:hypothetical protein
MILKVCTTDRGPHTRNTDLRRRNALFTDLSFPIYQDFTYKAAALPIPNNRSHLTIKMEKSFGGKKSPSGKKLN